MFGQRTLTLSHGLLQALAASISLCLFPPLASRQMTSCPASPVTERGPAFPSLMDLINGRTVNPLFNLDPGKLRRVGTIFTHISHSHSVKICIMEFGMTSIHPQKLLALAGSSCTM